MVKPAKIRRAYADTPQGQVHYRVIGEGDAVVLMHWAPASGRQHALLMEQLSARGFCVYAPDLMGYGDSDKPDRQWSIEDHAVNLRHWLDAVGLDSVYLYGGHTTAAVAVELSIEHPDRVRALVLDGSPVYDPAERAALVGTYAPPLVLHADGRQMQWAWDRAYRHPSLPLDEVFGDCLDLLKAGFTYHTAYEAVWAYDMAPRLPRLTTRTLALTTPDDPFAKAHRQVVADVPQCQEFLGPSRTSRSAVQRAEAEAKLFADFFRATS
jgi:pimeloyl-ACP methyl ester carboxylesterase